MVLGRPETTCKSMDMDLDPMPQAKVNSERVMDLNVRADTLKGLKENTGVNLCDLQFGNGLTLRHDTQAKREKQIWLHQNLNFCVTEDTVKTVKNKNQNHPTEQEKIPANCMSDNRLFEKIYKWPTSTWKGAWHQEPPWKCNSKPQIPLHTH